MLKPHICSELLTQQYENNTIHIDAQQEEIHALLKVDKGGGISRLVIVMPQHTASIQIF